MARWRRVAGAGLLALLLAGVAVPAAAAFASDSCCPGMAAAERDGASPARCQWITATSCCDEGAVVGSAGAFAPMPPAACAPAAVQPPLLRHPLRLPAAFPNPQMAALATIVLRL